MKRWLMKHSSVYRHFHPAPDQHVVCVGCGGKALPPSICGEHPHHAIGLVNYSDKGQRVICCDGSEDHV